MSTDAGATWTSKTLPSQGVGVTAGLGSINIATDGLGIVVAYNSLIAGTATLADISTDAGVTWVTRTIPVSLAPNGTGEWGDASICSRHLRPHLRLLRPRRRRPYLCAIPTTADIRGATIGPRGSCSATPFAESDSPHVWGLSGARRHRELSHLRKPVPRNLTRKMPVLTFQSRITRVRASDFCRRHPHRDRAEGYSARPMARFLPWLDSPYTRSTPVGSGPCSGRSPICRFRQPVSMSDTMERPAIFVDGGVRWVIYGQPSGHQRHPSGR